MSNGNAKKIVGYCLILLLLALWQRHESKKAAETALAKEFSAVSIAACGDPPARRKTVEQIRQELDVEIAAIEASTQSPAAMERYKVRKAVREARAERLEEEWAICANMAWERHTQGKQKQKTNRN